MPWPKGRKQSPEMIAKAVASRMARGAKRKASRMVDGIELWQCSTCDEWLPAIKFYSSKKNTNGLASECRTCHCKTSVASRDPEQSRQANRRYARRARLSHPEVFRERERNASRNRVQSERTIARNKLNAAVRRGDISKPEQCSECGEGKKLTAHHNDYSKPLEVEWLCYECHGKRHRKDSGHRSVLEPTP